MRREEAASVQWMAEFRENRKKNRAEIEAKLAGDLSPEEEAALMKELRDAETAALMQQARTKAGGETEDRAMTYEMAFHTLQARFENVRVQYGHTSHLIVLTVMLLVLWFC